MANSFTTTSFTSTSFTTGAVAPGGVEIVGTHAKQRLQRPEQLIPVEFTFQLLAGIFSAIEFRLLRIGDKLNPFGFYTDALRESFVLPLTEMRSKLKSVARHALVDILESTLSDALDDPLWCFKFLNDKIKRFKNGSE